MVTQKKKLVLTLIGAFVILFSSVLQKTARADTVTTRDVPYGSDPKQVVDVHEQRNAVDPLPAIIFLHGGGWIGGDKIDFTDQAVDYLIRSSYVGFNANYRLATTTTFHFPTQLDDVQRLVRWIRANADQYHVDRRRVGVVGISAGGNLAALLGTNDTRDNSDAVLAAYSSRVTCVADISGPVDITSFTTVGAEVFVSSYIGQTRAAAPELYRAASPIYSIDAKTVPFIIFQGTADVLVPYTQAIELDAALKAAGISSELHLYPDETHLYTSTAAVDIFNKARTFFDHTLSARGSSSIKSGVIFPSPFRPSQGHTLMHFKDFPPNARIRVFTETGENVADFTADANGNAHWDTNNNSGHHVASGLYFVEMEGNGERRVTKVVVQR